MSRALLSGTRAFPLARPRHPRRGLALLLAGCAALSLAACEPGSNAVSGTPAGESAKASRSTRLVARDVEAPQVFQVSDTALWDGRPSLGGVWVASPDVTEPERVIMRNPANGKFVIGALFKRERENPGPKLQISSDAADALGVLAGQPAAITVTALRREETREAPPPGPLLDSNEGLAASAQPAATGDAGGVISGPAVSATALAPAGSAAAPAPSAGIAAASAAIAAAEARPAAAASPAPAPAGASAKGRPIQIGFFSVEANASRAVATLAKSGVEASMRKESAKGKTYWTVVARGDAAMLTKIKAAGFADAYLLK